MGKIIRNVPDIPLSEDNFETLANKLDRMIGEGEEYKGRYNELHAEHLRMYKAIPRQRERDFPWLRASNVFLPLVRVVLDSLLSQIHDAILAGKPRLVGFEGGDERVAQRLSRFYFDFVWQRQLNLTELGNDWLFTSLLDGTGTVKNRWSKDLFLSREYDSEILPITQRSPSFEQGTEIDRRIVVDFDTEITEQSRARRDERPIVDVVDMVNLYVAPGSGNSLQWPVCKWYYEVSWHSWDELQQWKRRGMKNIDEALRSHEVQPDEPDAQREHEVDEGLSPNAERQRIKVVTFFMREVLPGTYIDDSGDEHTQRFMDDGGISEEVVVTYFPSTRKVGRVIPLKRIRRDGKRPHIENRYKRIPNVFFGMGVPGAMKQLQSITNQLYNQMIDTGTLQNLPFFFVNPGMTGMLPQAGSIYPGAFIPVEDIRGIEAPRLQGDRLFYAQALQMTQQWQERDSAVTDFVLGQNPATPNAPRTAQGQNQMIQQANIAFSRLVALMVQPFLELLRQVHSLYQLHAPDNLEFRFFNEQTQMFRREQVSSTDFDEEVDFIFEVNPNRQVEAEQNLLLFNLLGQIVAQANPQGLRALARQLYESMGKKNFNEIWPDQIALQSDELNFLQPPPAQTTDEEEQLDVL